MAKRIASEVLTLPLYPDLSLETVDEICDIMLVASSNEETSFGFEPSCATVAQMVILDCLYILITNRMKEEASECFRLTCEAIESERE